MGVSVISSCKTLHILHCATCVNW